MNEQADEALTSDDVASLSFPEVEHGFDQGRVAAALHAIADEMRRLEDDLARAEGRATKPFLQAGKEMGSLLQKAHDEAQAMLREAEMKVATLQQEAHRLSVRAEDDARAHMNKAQQEARGILEDSRAESARLKARSAELHRRAEAESSVILREAETQARRMRAEAKKAADAVVEGATHVAVQEERALVSRVRRLQQMEAELRKRVDASSRDAGTGAGRDTEVVVDDADPLGLDNEPSPRAASPSETLP